MNFRPHLTGRPQTAMELAWNKAVLESVKRKKAPQAETPSPQQLPQKYQHELQRRP